MPPWYPCPYNYIHVPITIFLLKNGFWFSTTWMWNCLLIRFCQLQIEKKWHILGLENYFWTGLCLLLMMKPFSQVSELGLRGWGKSQPSQMSQLPTPTCPPLTWIRSVCFIRYEHPTSIKSHIEIWENVKQWVNINQFHCPTVWYLLFVLKNRAIFIDCYL